MDLKLKGKKAFISGGTHGIGLSIAKNLGQEGCEIIICSRTIKRLNFTLDLLKNMNISAYGYQCDALIRDDIDKCINIVKDEIGGIDILVNNVGGGGSWGSEDITNTDEIVWHQVYEKNVTAAIKFTNGFLPSMVENNWGRVITITSTHGIEAGGRPWFNIAKTAQTALMKNLSKNKMFVKRGITFNCIAPGPIDIPDTGWAIKKKEPKFEEFIDTLIPMGKLGKPEDVANIVSFIASPLAKFINGSSITVDGGASTAF